MNCSDCGKPLIQGLTDWYPCECKEKPATDSALPVRDAPAPPRDRTYVISGYDEALVIRGVDTNIGLIEFREPVQVENGETFCIKYSIQRRLSPALRWAQIIGRGTRHTNTEEKSNAEE